VYTAIMGGKDDLKRPKVVDPGIDYLCFTDTPKLFIGRRPWRIISVPHARDPVRAARKIKLMPHEYVGDYERSLWVDGKVRIWQSIHGILKYVPPELLMVWSHWQRNCTYSEARVCKMRGKDLASVISKQMRRYVQEGLPEHYGLVRSEILLRMHNNRTLIKFSEAWWEEVQRYSRRDQLSFMYVCWQQGFEPFINDDQGEYNKHFKVYRHAR